MNVNERNNQKLDPNHDPADNLVPEHKPNADSNPDPITGEHGARPVGTGVGAASAGAVGTAVGVIVGGPIGGAVGAVVGSVAGGLLGKGVAETLDPTVEDEYWRHNYATRPYVETDHSYEDYGPAYRVGYEGYSTYSKQGLSYQDAEPHLRQAMSSMVPIVWAGIKQGTLARMHGIGVSRTFLTTTPASNKR